MGDPSVDSSTPRPAPAAPASQPVPDAISSAAARAATVVPPGAGAKAGIAADKANEFFREFQSAKHDGANDVPARQARAVKAAQESADLWHALEDATSEYLSPDGALKLHDKVYEADCLLEKSKESTFGLALTAEATDDVVKANGRLIDAKNKLDELRLAKAPDAPELKQARAEADRTAEELKAVLRKRVDLWQKALDQARTANEATCEFWLAQAKFLQKTLKQSSGD